MASSASKTALAATAGVAAAIGSALCCAGPLVAVALGLSGAGLAATFEPLRPYFVAGTVLSLGLGFVVLGREDRPDGIWLDVEVPRALEGLVRPYRVSGAFRSTIRAAA